jgi:molecular chaperone GrpE
MADEMNHTNPDDSVKEQPEIPSQAAELSDLDLLSAKITELENSITQYKDQLLRKAAEFENYKKRVENDYASMIRFSNEDLIVKLLPVVDDFERSLKANKEHDAQSTENVFMKGIGLINGKLKKILEGQGLKHFEVLGKPFDPQLHDALLQMPKDDVPPHTIIEEVEKGYMLHDKVIRHARVIVSADTAQDENAASESKGAN